MMNPFSDDAEPISSSNYGQAIAPILCLAKTNAKAGALHYYSCRSAMSGSTFVARRAGIQQASKATAHNNAVTTTNVTGSVALTS